nr:AraC family transcriptional regulator [uncultured Anaerostipes sp.]
MQVTYTNKNDKSENVLYDIPDFPAYIRRGHLASYPDYSAISHWHDDVEFILVLSGYMEYSVNGKIVTVKEGEGIFVNTRQLHYGFSSDRSDCDFICILLHPFLLCSVPFVEKEYIAPVMENEAMPYLLLHPEKKYEEEILRAVDEMYRCHGQKTAALRVQNLFFKIWENLFLLSGHLKKTSKSGNHHLTILRDMLRFIYEHYDQKISLTQISKAGNVGKTTCCTIFQKYTNETPVSYLISYRIKKGIELLETTDKTISEIALEVGFSGASYFTEIFHRAYGCTPTEYRAEKKITLS